MKEKQLTQDKVAKNGRRYAKAKIVALGIYSVCASLGLATPAYAVTDPTEVLGKVMPLIQQGVTFLGGALVIWGAVKLGLAIKDQQGGNALSESIATIAGGAVVIAAGVFFGQLSW